MNKHIDCINGYSCVQVQVQVQFYDFSALKLPECHQSARDVLTHAFYSLPPPYETLMHDLNYDNNLPCKAVTYHICY